jgi:hypothetical protein
VNERIEKLARQAGALPTQDCGVPQWYIDEDEFEKFAELIVQDCIDILAGYRGKVTWLNEEEGHQHPIFVIQNHFGIKRQ